MKTHTVWKHSWIVIAKKKKRKIIRLLPRKHATCKNAPLRNKEQHRPLNHQMFSSIRSLSGGVSEYPVPQLVDFCGIQHHYLSQESLALFWRALVPFSLVESLGQCAGIWRHLNFQMRESPTVGNFCLVFFAMIRIGIWSQEIGVYVYIMIYCIYVYIYIYIIIQLL